MWQAWAFGEGHRHRRRHPKPSSSASSAAAASKNIAVIEVKEKVDAVWCSQLDQAVSVKDCAAQFGLHRIESKHELKSVSGQVVKHDCEWNAPIVLTDSNGSRRRS